MASNYQKRLLGEADKWPYCNVDTTTFFMVREMFRDFVGRQDADPAAPKAKRSRAGRG
jgi:hypothetical protein